MAIYDPALFWAAGASIAEEGDRKRAIVAPPFRNEIVHAAFCAPWLAIAEI